MSIQSVVLPVFVELALVFALLGLTAILRKAALKHGVRAADIALGDGAFPKRARQAANCYGNQFEMPILFVLAVVFGIVLHQAGRLFVALEWIFVIFRLAHAAIHVGNNAVTARGMLFLGSAISTALLWALIFIGIFFGAVVS